MTDDAPPRTINDFSDEERAEFFDTADRFIDVANEMSRSNEAGPRRISSAMMYATARYNAFIAHLGGYKGGETEENDVVAYYLGEYEKVLRKHLGDTLVAEEEAEDGAPPPPPPLVF